jgi:lipid-A-disaccharide synthase-like uncharacterized protein
MIQHLTNLSITDMIWLAIGFGGQFLFAGRFLLQWLYTEKQRKSVIPIGFWYLSIIGGVTLFFYALHLHDPVFTLGQSLGILVYSRNLYFIYKEHQAKQQA